MGAAAGVPLQLVTATYGGIDLESCVGLINFYSPYIPNCKLRMSKLHNLLKLNYEQQVGPHLTHDHLDEREYLLNAILVDPCLCR